MSGAGRVVRTEKWRDDDCDDNVVQCQVAKGASALCKNNTGNIFNRKQLPWSKQGLSGSPRFKMAPGASLKKVR